MEISFFFFFFANCEWFFDGARSTGWMSVLCMVKSRAVLSETRGTKITPPCSFPSWGLKNMCHKYQWSSSTPSHFTSTYHMISYAQENIVVWHTAVVTPIKLATRRNPSPAGAPSSRRGKKQNEKITKTSAVWSSVCYTKGAIASSRTSRTSLHAWTYSKCCCPPYARPDR